MKKFIFVVLIALVLAGGMVLVSCKNPDCPGKGDCDNTGFIDQLTNCNNWYKDVCLLRGKCNC